MDRIPLLTITAYTRDSPSQKHAISLSEVSLLPVPPTTFSLCTESLYANQMNENQVLHPIPALAPGVPKI